MSNIEELKSYCLRVINDEIETSKIETKSFLDIDEDYFKWQFIRCLAALANTPPDLIIPYGLLVVGVENSQIVDNVSQWVKDDNEYQNLIRAYCYPMIDFSFYRMEHESRNFGVFVVPNSAERPHVIIRDIIYHNQVRLARGQIYVREGSETKVALKEQIHRFIIDDLSNRINKSLDELSLKDTEVAEMEFLPEDATIPLRTRNEIKDHLLRNLVKVRKILRGLS